MCCFSTVAPFFMSTVCNLSNKAFTKHSSYCRISQRSLIKYSLLICNSTVMNLLSTTQLSLSNLSCEHGDNERNNEIGISPTSPNGISPTSPMPAPLAGHLMFPHKYAVRVNKYSQHNILKRADTGSLVPPGNIATNKLVRGVFFLKTEVFL